AHPHDDQVVPALLHLGEDRLVWRHVGVHGGSCRHVVAGGPFDGGPPECPLPLGGAEGPAASAACLCWGCERKRAGSGGRGARARAIATSVAQRDTSFPVTGTRMCNGLCCGCLR